MRERLDLLAILPPALHGAEVQAQGESRIRRHAGAQEAEAGLTNLLFGPAHRCLDLRLVSLANLAGGGIDATCEVDHGILGTCHGLCAAIPQLQAYGRVRELRALDQTRRERVRRVMGEQSAHER